LAGLGSQGFTAELPEQGEPAIGQELIRIHHADGRVEELRLHQYDRVYSLPGLYELIVHGRLGCRSPEQSASMLANTVDRLGWDRANVRVIDLAAGNGISGQALIEQGLCPVLGTDIVPEAREAALRDRPTVYPAYETLDLLALTDEQERRMRALSANAVSCVAPVGTGSEQLPPPALAAAVKLLTADALVTYLHDPTLGVADAVTAGFWARELGTDVKAERLESRPYLHRQTVSGKPYEMVGVIWRVRRAG
jgi:hypothetical protein